MITRENIKEVVLQLSDTDKKRLRNTNKEYAVLELHVVNTGSWTTLKLTDDYNKYKNVYKHGACILDPRDVLQYLPEIITDIDTLESVLLSGSGINYD